MGILSECPICKKKQSNKKRSCSCGEDLAKAKRSSRVRYWIDFYIPGGKQRREPVGYSIEEARDAMGKRRGQKREGRIFDIKPDNKMTFNELTKWYLKLETVKDLASYGIIKITLSKFNKTFGDMVICKIKPADLENYQASRKKQGKAPATIDHEIGKAKTMSYKAFDNDLVGADTLKAFKKMKKTLKPGSDVRDRILSQDEFNTLIEKAVDHLKPILYTAYYTGMRKGEIVNLTWDRVDLKNKIIRLEASDTKDNQARAIPICKELFSILQSLSNRIQAADKDNHVFLFRGKPIEDIRAALTKACTDAGIEYGRFAKGGFIFHDLRHTFNTNMRKAGVSESVIMEITGHSTREMFDRYNRIDEDDTRKAIVQLETFFENIDQILTKTKNRHLKVNHESL